MDVPNHHSPQVPGVFPKVAANFANPCPQEEEGGRFQKFNSFGQHFAFTSGNPIPWQESIGYIAPQIHPPKKNIIDNSKLVQKHTQAIILKNI